MTKIGKTLPRKGFLSIGDTVVWCGGWGRDKPTHAKVTGFEWSNEDKSGDSIKESISWDLLDGRQIIVDLNNGHWAYGFQLSALI